MNRKEFLQMSLLTGLGLPFSSLWLAGCAKEESIFPTLQTNYSGKVVIVGAGAAGLAAGSLLHHHGVDFEILEAAPVYGGRMKRADDFADFPIDLGAEWIHTHPSILSEILNQPDLDAAVDILVYNPQTIKNWNEGKLRSHNAIRHFYSEWKFKSTTWYGFFERYVVPPLADRLRLGQAVTRIDASGQRVLLETSEGASFEADHVLLTVPITMLQKRRIEFVPPLPEAQIEAIDSIFMGDGIKIFVEFRERFYPDILAFGPIFDALDAEEKFVYDAAFRKDSSRNILGLFAINEPAAVYTRLETDEAILAHFLQELDTIFDGQASAHYLQHIIENWSAQPFIQGAYSYSFSGNQRRTVATLSEAVHDKIFLCGEAFSLEHQSTVHGACESGFAAAARLLRG